jgi:hypothetical protein
MSRPQDERKVCANGSERSEVSCNAVVRAGRTGGMPESVMRGEAPSVPFVVGAEVKIGCGDT